MKSSKLIGLLPGLLALAGIAASAQVAPFLPAVKSSEETAVQLSPFVVDGTGDAGYRAESTLAGSRLNTSLRDTPASVQVYTKEFLEDIGAVSLQDVLNYSVNVEDGAGDEEAFFGGAFAQRGFINFQPRVRGLPSSQARDYFSWQLPIDNYVTERLDESRGPNALLFGIAAAGGIQNQSTKKASVARNFNQLTFRTDSYGLIRGEIDLNRALIKNKLALRINALHADGDKWQSNTFDKKKAIHGALTYRPDNKTMIQLSFESFSQDDSLTSAFVETDFVKQWLTAGAPVFDLFSAGRIPQASANGTVTAAGLNTILRKVGATTLGANPQIALVEGGHPSLDGQVVDLYRALLTQSFVDVTGNGQFNLANNIALDASVFPYDVGFNGPANTRYLDAVSSAVSVQRELIERLFVQADFARYSYYWDTMPGGDSVRGDANAFFAGPNRSPASAIPNPNAGKAFVYTANHTRWVTDREQDTYRLTATYAFDFTRRGRGLLSKLGSHRIAAGVEHVDYASDQPVLRLGWFDAATRRPAYDPSGPGGTNFVASLKYIDLKDPSSWTGLSLRGVGVPITDPLDPRRRIVAEWTQQFNAAWDVEQKIDAKMFSTQSSFLDKRLVVTAGYREDKGSNTKFLYKLDDLNRAWVRIGPEAVNVANWKVHNFTTGAVFHVNRAFSVFYNQATNSNIPDADAVIIGSLDKPGQVTFPGGGEGADYGIMARFLNDRINLRLTRYQSRENNALNGSGAAANLNNGLHDQVIKWWSDIGFGLPGDPAAARLFQDRVNRFTLSKQSDGYEFQLTANFTKNWSGVFNYSYTNKNQTNVGIVEKQWFANTIEWATRTVRTWDTTKVTPALINAGIVPTNRPDEFLLNNGTTSLAQLIESAEVWSATNLVPGSPFGLRRDKFNFFTSYTFSEGRPRGISVGGGYRYSGPNALHWVAGANGSRTQLLGESNAYADAMLRYRTKMKRGGKDVRVSFQLNVQNLFDDSKPTIARYLRNNSSNPPDRLYYVEPRNFRFSTTLDF